MRIREFRRHRRDKQQQIVAFEEKTFALEEESNRQLAQLVAEAEPIVRKLEQRMREQQELEEVALPIVLEYEQPLPCTGILLKEMMIKTTRKKETDAALTKGFLNLVGNAIGKLGHSISHNLPPIWPNDDQAVRGFVDFS
jgi:hypothetical protein